MSVSNEAVGSVRKLVTAIPGPKSQAMHDRRHKVVSKGVSQGLPVYIDKAEGAILLDIDGNRFLDLGAGIAVVSIGHAVPEVAKAIADQANDFLHTCFMVTP